EDGRTCSAAVVQNSAGTWLTRMRKGSRTSSDGSGPSGLRTSTVTPRISHCFMDAPFATAGTTVFAGRRGAIGEVADVRDDRQGTDEWPNPAQKRGVSVYSPKTSLRAPTCAAAAH